MINLRAEKIRRMQVPDAQVVGPATGDVLVIGWGGTYGALLTATEQARAEGAKVSLCHLRYLNPLPKNLGAVLRSFERVLVPELNLGQLRMVLRSEFLVDAVGFNKVKGRPFQVGELVAKIHETARGQTAAKE
jgi:2-oxoglutarate ferredoxin oxidoreductase subunit alpha